MGVKHAHRPTYLLGPPEDGTQVLPLVPLLIHETRRILAYFTERRALDPGYQRVFLATGLFQAREAVGKMPTGTLGGQRPIRHLVVYAVGFLPILPGDLRSIRVRSRQLVIPMREP